MIGISSGFAMHSNFGFQISSTPISSLARPGTVRARRASDPDTPVQPVRAAPPVTVEASGNVDLIRSGADPVEMAVRMRIQYAE